MGYIFQPSSLAHLYQVRGWRSLESFNFLTFISISPTWYFLMYLNIYLLYDSVILS